MSTPRQWPSWEKRDVWEKVPLISSGVQISITGDGGEMVDGLSLGQCFSLFFFFF